MRLKNNPKASEWLQNSKYIVQNPFFDNDYPICLEIGMGKGDFIINMAIKYPNINFVGVEKYATVLMQAVKKLENLELPNLKLMLLDANCINEIFNKKIDTLYLNFSDPWPKKRHSKRRLTSYNFLEKYDSIFVNNAHIIFKTDNRSLFEYSIVSLSNYGYKINDICLDLHSSNQENVETEYERKFSSSGAIIYKLDATLYKIFTVKK